MKIAVISALKRSGAYIAARRIGEALQRAGHSCSFYTLADFYGPDAQNFWESCALEHWSGLLGPEALKDGAEFFSDSFLALHPYSPLPEAILEADAIHLHWAGGMIFSPALLQAMQGKKVLWTLHDMNAFTGGCHYHPTCEGYKNKCGHCPMLSYPAADDASARVFQLKRALYDNLDLTIATPSAWLAELARGSRLLDKFPVSAIPNCLDTEIFKPQDRLKSRAIFGLNPQSFVFMFGSEHFDTPRKNNAIVLGTLQRLHRENPELSFEALIVGKAPEIPALPFMVHSLGFLEDQAQMATAYSAADIYIHVSLLDNLPNTVCEAQSCGTPVVAFDAGGSKETFIPGKTGFLIEKNQEALLAALRFVLTNRDQLQQFSLAARNYALERFGMANIAESYSKLLAENKPGPAPEPDREIMLALLQNQTASLADALNSWAIREKAAREKVAADIAQHAEEQRRMAEEQRRMAEEQRRMAETLRQLDAKINHINHSLSYFDAFSQSLAGRMFKKLIKKE